MSGGGSFPTPSFLEADVEDGGGTEELVVAVVVADLEEDVVGEEDVAVRGLLREEDGVVPKPWMALTIWPTLIELRHSAVCWS